MSNDIVPTTPSEPEVVNTETEYNLTATTKFIEAFHKGYNVSEACSYVGISRVSYYAWLKHHPEFEKRVTEAREMPNRVAKEMVIGAIKGGDVNSAKWWLDRRDPDFKAKLEVDPGEESRATRDKIKEFLDEPTDYTASEPDAAGAEPTAAIAPTSSDEVATAPPDIS